MKHSKLGYILYIPTAENISKSIYLKLTDKLMPEYDGRELIKFFKLNDASEFILGEDWFVSKSLANDLNIDNEEYIIDDYVDDWFYESNELIKVNSTIENIQHYYMLNILLNSSFTEDEIYNFASSFATIIIDYSEKQNNSTLTNTIYNHVLTWLQNGQNDTAMTLMNMIFSGKVSITTNSSLSNCGCSTSSDSINTSVSCYDMYIEALKTWISSMFGDTGFYYDWFFINSGDETNEPNETMIDALIELIELLKQINLNIDNNYSRIHNCGCIDKSLDTSYISILNNYIKVLSFIKECKIEENTNKIKTWGTEFGQILPKLIFN